jgi:hypothetical protein
MFASPPALFDILVTRKRSTGKRKTFGSGQRYTIVRQSLSPCHKSYDSLSDCALRYTVIVFQLVQLGIDILHMLLTVSDQQRDCWAQGGSKFDLRFKVSWLGGMYLQVSVLSLSGTVVYVD